MLSSTLILITFYVVPTISQEISEHLLPPPLNGNILPKIQGSIPFNPPPLSYISGNGPPYQIPARTLPPESPGLMQRVARWFGFSGDNINDNTLLAPSPTHKQSISPAHAAIDQPKEQLSQASYQQPQYKQAPYQYNKPKAQCNPCNKVPWIPMFPGNVQYPLVNNNYQQPISQIKFNHHPEQHDIGVPSTQLHHINNLPFQQYAPNFHNNQVQRAVQFNFPQPNEQNINFLQSHQPIPIPNLSASPIPPLYNAHPFRNSYQQTQGNIANVEHLSQPSEIWTQLPPNEFSEQQFNKDFDFVQSVPVTDYVSSIEYPVKYSEGKLIDLSKNSNVPNIDNNLQKDSVLNEHPRVIELGGNEHYASSQHNSISNPIIHNHDTAGDNFPEASSFNLTFKNENILDQGNEYSTTIIPFVQETFLPTQVAYTTTAPKSSDSINKNSPNLNNHFVSPGFYYSTTAKPNFVHISSTNGFQSTSSSNEHFENTNHHKFEQSTEPLHFVTPNFKPDQFFEQQTVESTLVDVQPSLQTISQRPQNKNHRDTPKHLLDAPIIYNHNRLPNNSPRPFTKDPSELNIRGAANQNLLVSDSSTTQTPWANSPTPTSTYSSLDASGQYAGISPPSQFQPNFPVNFNNPTEKKPKQIHQIIIPYTTKTKPSPFKVRTENEDNRFSAWSHSNEEVHDHQESKLVTAKQHSTQQTTRKTTKYLTKILASNIRELLRKEHDNKNKSFGVDLNRLQKNIDDWTEQEFSSPSRRPSTVSIRGRSKHIPKEYLTTTPSLRQAKTTRFHTTINPKTTNAMLMSEKNDFINHLWDKKINNNQVESQEFTNNVDISTSQPFTTKPTTTTTEASVYIRNIKPTKQTENEIWQKVKVSISPLTKEKVYVVTPQPAGFQIKSTTPDGVGTFKSPRFIVRPTPATSGPTNATEKSSKSGYSPELFGLMGISAYIPAAPVDVLDGHSRVITVVTPTPHNSNKRRSLDEKNMQNNKFTKERTKSIKDKNS